MPKGIAITIGLDFVDKDLYGSNNACPCAGHDATQLAQIAAAQSFDAETYSFRNEDATADAVLSSMTEAGAGLDAGDYLLIYMSCHGGEVTNAAGQTASGLALYDRVVLNEELAAVWAGFANALRFFVVIDACESANKGGFVSDQEAFRGLFGGMGKRPKIPVIHFGAAPKKHQPIPKLLKTSSRVLYDRLNKNGIYDQLFASMDQIDPNAPPATAAGILLTACQSDQLAGGCGQQATDAVFTAALLKVWSDQSSFNDFQTFRDQIAALIQSTGQKPYIAFETANDPDFKGVRPITLV